MGIIKRILGLEKKGILVMCNCGHVWKYKGKSRKYITCPKCLSKINIIKAQGNLLEFQLRKLKSIMY
jgi:hypothetical protein